MSLHHHPYSTHPPTLCVTTAGKKVKMLQLTKVRRGRKKTERRVKEEKTVKAGVCLELSDASIHHHEPDSSLMEYPGQRRSRRRQKKGEEEVEEKED